jgi:hypothetical protein
VPFHGLRAGMATIFAQSPATPRRSPSGTVTFYDGGVSLGTSQAILQRAAVYGSPLRHGSHTLSAIYSGDGEFLPSYTTNHTVQVARAISTITATAVHGSDVRIALHGVTGVPPGGIIAADEDGSTPRNVFGPLTPLDDIASAVTITGVSSTGRTLNVTYFGDPNYVASVTTVTIVRPKRRAAGH